MKHLKYLGVIVIFFSYIPTFLAQLTVPEDVYTIRPLFELDQLATGEAYPWISEDGLRIYYTAFNSTDSVYSIWYSERENIEMSFDLHFLLGINSDQEDNLSAWLTQDERIMAYAKRCDEGPRDSEIYISKRGSIQDDFSEFKKIELPDMIKGTVLSPSFTPDLKQMFLFNEYKGHSYVLILEQESEYKYNFKSEIQFPDHFTPKAGKLSQDGLTYYLSLQQGNRKPTLWTMKRNELNDDFEKVDKIKSDILNDKSNRNHQVHFSSNQNFIVFTQSDYNEWSQNGIYIVQRNNIQEREQEIPPPSQDSSLEDISVFPNPSIDHIYFRNVEDKSIRIDIFDATGSLVQVLRDLKDNELVDIGYLEPGSYFLRVIDTERKDYRIIKHIKL